MPLIHWKNNVPTQVGIVSTGLGSNCLSKPGISTRISSKYPWIMKTACYYAEDLCESHLEQVCYAAGMDRKGGKVSVEYFHVVQYIQVHVSHTFQIYPPLLMQTNSHQSKGRVRFLEGVVENSNTSALDVGNMSPEAILHGDMVAWTAR